jgi:hypothetical protein
MMEGFVAEMYDENTDSDSVSVLLPLGSNEFVIY